MQRFWTFLERLVLRHKRQRTHMWYDATKEYARCTRCGLEGSVDKYGNLKRDRNVRVYED